MMRVRTCTMRCRCHNSCRRSRFSQLGTQICGKSSFNMSLRISCASCRSVFCLRTRLLWISAASPIHNKRVRKQKTDRQDAQLILRLMLKDDFPQIWVPSWENRDLRQLLWHRHRMVQVRTRIMNQLQALALNEGLRCKKRLWREHGRRQLESFRLAPWASWRRRDLLELLDRLNPTIAELSQAIEQEAEKCPEAQRLMTHPGVGPLTALAFVLIIGKAERFQCGKQIASYLGLVPLEKSSGNRRRLGHITKQGSSMVRFLLVEAAQVTVRSLPEWRRKYVQLMMRRGRKIAKVAMARRLAVALYWMWRKGWNYEQSKSSVRTRASSEQAMVCSRTPSN